jgi:phage terminase small subunit
MAQGRKSKKRDRKRLPFARPPHLDAAQSSEWDRIVAAQAADWFVSGAEILLECYVVSVCYMRALHKKRAEMLVDPDNTPSSLIGISESIAAEARNLIALARQLRLSQQSRVRADGAKERPVMPWEDDDEEEGTG